MNNKNSSTDKHEQPSGPTDYSPSRWIMIFMLVTLIVILFGGVWYYRGEKKRIQRDCGNQLISITAMKRQEIINWRHDQIRNVELIAYNMSTVEAMKNVIAGSNDPVRDKFITRLRQYQSRFGYHEIIITGPDGSVFIRLTGGRAALSADMLASLNQCRRLRQIVLSDLHFSAVDKVSHLDVIAPIFDGPEDLANPVIGYIFFRINAATTLSPLLQSWPFQTDTAETLLVRRDGDQVLFLNELRHQTNTALNLTIPLSKTDVPAVMAVKGHRGLFEGRDYRGVQVVSVMEQIPDSTWSIISKIDKHEVFAEWQVLSWNISFLVIGLLAATLAFSGLIWQRHGKSCYQAMFNAEQEKNQAVVALAFTNQQLRASEQQLQAVNQQLRAGEQQLRAANQQLRAGEQQLLAVNQQLRANTEKMLSTLSLLESTLESTVDGILVADGKGKMVLANAKFFKIWDMPDEISISKDDNAALAFAMSQLKDPERFLKIVRGLYETPEDNSFDVLEFKDGRVIERYSQPQRIGSLVVGRVWCFRDITVELGLRAQLTQAHKMESVGRLAGGVAHDFNNMLLGIIGNAELCRDGLPAEHPCRCYMEEIINGAQRSADLTKQLLAFASKQTIVPRVLNLNDAMMGILKLLRRLIGEDIDLIWRPGANLGLVKLDPSQVDQILTNLCVNARDAIDNDGQLIIETSNVTIKHEDYTGHAGLIPGDYVLICASDNGRGMEKGLLEHIFEPFFTTKGIGHGTGLGLSTVYGIVKQNNGFIYVDSEPGKGTTFKVYLPRCAGSIAQPDGPVFTDTPKGQGETVLLVEDEATLREICRHFLKSLGYNVLEAANPAAALDLASRYVGEIQVLLTDVIMPGMNGQQLAERLGAVRRNLNILFMSGYSADIIINRNDFTRGISFIGKPFTRGELAIKLREVLDRKHV